MSAATAPSLKEHRTARPRDEPSCAALPENAMLAGAKPVSLLSTRRVPSVPHAPQQRRLAVGDDVAATAVNALLLASPGLATKSQASVCAVLLMPANKMAESTSHAAETAAPPAARAWKFAVESNTGRNYI